VPEKQLDQLANVPEWMRHAFAYGWILFLAWFGGVVNYIRKMRAGEIGRFNFTEFVGDMFTSSFSGVIAFLICHGAGFNEWLTAAIIGMSGHMGSRAIFFFEKWLEKRYGVPPASKEKSKT